ncbi:MAG: amidase [Alphaproteobacteria bacterium]
MSADDLTLLDALSLRDRLAAGEVSARALVDACLARIDAREPEVQAWVSLDPDHARAQADALDRHRAAGGDLGPLHGLPVAIKDVIDTADMPTENGTVLDAGRQPAEDAFCVARLRQAGAVILGKTVTAELASQAPGVTRNPHNAGHTPGGSSSGSAAAVACGMAPLALGTQTGGSVIRPASFCGIVGFKPSFGALPRPGVLLQSQTLDTVGVFASTVEGVALAAEPLYGFDTADPSTAPRATPRLLGAARGEPPTRPKLAFVRPPAWPDAEPDTHEGFARIVAALGDDCVAADLPAAFAEADAQRLLINRAEAAKHYRRYVERGRDKLSQSMQDLLAEGEKITAADYLRALDARAVLNAGLAGIFERCDAILTPATLGPAPKGIESTGNPVFNSLWTLCGTPCVTLPLLTASNGLPMGVQLVGPRGGDARLLRTARWLMTRLAA